MDDIEQAARQYIESHYLADLVRCEQVIDTGETGEWTWHICLCAITYAFNMPADSRISILAKRKCVGKKVRCMHISEAPLAMRRKIALILTIMQ